jgi:hypothetical protein
VTCSIPLHQSINCRLSHQKPTSAEAILYLPWRVSITVVAEAGPCALARPGSCTLTPDLSVLVLACCPPSTASATIVQPREHARRGVAAVSSQGRSGIILRWIVHISRLELARPGSLLPVDLTTDRSINTHTHFSAGSSVSQRCTVSTSISDSPAATKPGDRLDIRFCVGSCHRAF